MSAEEQEHRRPGEPERSRQAWHPLGKPQLVEAAQIQSTDMAELGDMDHVLTGAALPTLQDRAAYVGYNYLLPGREHRVQLSRRQFGDDRAG